MGGDGPTTSPVRESLEQLRMRPVPPQPHQPLWQRRPSRRRTCGRRERFLLPAAAAVAMAAPAPGLISVFSSPQELGASLAQLVVQRAACCLEGPRARFALGLSGGSLVSMLARDLPAAAAPAGPAGLARWTLGFCDERLVPFEHAESTYGLYRVRATGAAGVQAWGHAHHLNLCYGGRCGSGREDNAHGLVWRAVLTSPRLHVDGRLAPSRDRGNSLPEGWKSHQVPQAGGLLSPALVPRGR